MITDNFWIVWHNREDLDKGEIILYKFKENDLVDYDKMRKIIAKEHDDKKHYIFLYGRIEQKDNQTIINLSNELSTPSIKQILLKYFKVTGDYSFEYAGDNFEHDFLRQRISAVKGNHGSGWYRANLTALKAPKRQIKAKVKENPNG